jgi:hypothetical protein
MSLNRSTTASNPVPEPGAGQVLVDQFHLGLLAFSGEPSCRQRDQRLAQAMATATGSAVPSPKPRQSDRRSASLSATRTRSSSDSAAFLTMAARTAERWRGCLARRICGAHGSFPIRTEQRLLMSAANADAAHVPPIARVVVSSSTKSIPGYRICVFVQERTRRSNWDQTAHRRRPLVISPPIGY